MGLSISRSIINRHQGRIWVENNPDGSDALFQPAGSPWREGLKPRMTEPPPTVFVVDDDALVRKSLARLLKSAGMKTCSGRSTKPSSAIIASAASAPSVTQWQGVSKP